MTPETLGPYVLGPQLGKGGMGSVYRAKHEATGEEVAVKVLSPRLAVAEGFRGRFEGEIESLKALRHTGIVRLNGYGEEEGVYFYAMELVDGPSLEEELRNGRRFDWSETTQIAIQVCRALKHAHDHGVVHRDLKPANILLAPSGEAKLADFGIARMFGSTGVTIAGGVLGTADYMSPEQAAGTPVTARCDQYSLGGVLYALLTGRPPFRAADMAAMLQLQRFAIPEPVRRFAPDTPLELERIVAKLLEKDPSNRFPNTRVVARRLEAMSQALARVAHDDFEVLATGRVRHEADDELALAATRDATDAEAPRPKTQAPSIFPAATSAGVARSYVHVPEEDESDEAAKWRAFAGPAALVGTLLLAVGLAAWRFLQPVNADAHYDQLAEKMESEEFTTATRSSVTVFLDRFPDDPRTEEVARWGQSLELEQLRRRMKLSRWLGGGGGSAEEALLRRAASLAAIDPAEGAEAYAAAAQLLGSDEQVGRGVASLAEFAQGEADRLRKEALAERRRLAEYFAERLRKTTDPERLAEVARAVVRLAPTSPETAEVVERAGAILKGADAAASRAPVAPDAALR